MGSVRARNNGKLFLDFRYAGVRCREQTLLDDSPQNRKKARKFLEEVEKAIADGTFSYEEYFPKSPMVQKFGGLPVTGLNEANKPMAPVRSPSSVADTPLFQEFAENWIGEMKIEWRDSYVVSTRITLGRYLNPFFGKKAVGNITRSDILEFRSTLAKVTAKNTGKGLSASRINHIMMPLRMIMNEAANRYQFTSPYQGIKSIKVPRTDVEPFTIEEVRKILDTVREDFRNYLTVRFFTGMRSSEIDGLQWQFVDFERGQILVRQALVKGVLNYTKNDGSFREIQMSQPVLEALRAQKRVTGRHRFVFCADNGEPFLQTFITRQVWYPLLRYLCLRKRRPYQTRHTAATLWLAAGESPEWIARQMGHTTTEMLFRVYSRYVPNLTRQDGSAFEQLLQAQLATESYEEIDDE